ncbi:hypothetical protein Y032_0384g414 [Ancylostoma ceylanicum]|nr:hypothetical protein Y032_0384g414 [Ancylostoma ceylanicum]
METRDEWKSDLKNRNSEVGGWKPHKRPEHRKCTKTEAQKVQCGYSNGQSCSFAAISLHHHASLSRTNAKAGAWRCKFRIHSLIHR